MSPSPPPCDAALLQNPKIPACSLHSPLHSHPCWHPSSPKLHGAHWQGRTVGNSHAATADHVLQEQLWLETRQASNPAARAEARGMHPLSSSSLHRTRRESSYACIQQAERISPALILPQEEPFLIKLAEVSSLCPLPCNDALPLPSIFSSLANSPNVGKAFRQTDRDFASTVQLPHVIFPPEAGKLFSHTPLTSGQKSWLE